MQIMFGGQADDTDFHCIGFDLEILGVHLTWPALRISAASRAFQDSRILDFYGIPISLNVEERKRT